MEVHNICTFFAHPVLLQGIRVKFVYDYEGHRVKVKVTGAKGQISIFPQCKKIDRQRRMITLGSLESAYWTSC